MAKLQYMSKRDFPCKELDMTVAVEVKILESAFVKFENTRAHLENYLYEKTYNTIIIYFIVLKILLLLYKYANTRQHNKHFHLYKMLAVMRLKTVK